MSLVALVLAFSRRKILSLEVPSRHRYLTLAITWTGFVETVHEIECSTVGATFITTRVNGKCGTVLSNQVEQTETATSPFATPTVSRRCHAIPYRPHDSTQHNSQRWDEVKVLPAHKTRGDNDHPPRITTQAASVLNISIQVSYFEQSIYGRKDEPDRGGVDASQACPHYSHPPHHRPETDEASVQPDPRQENGNEPDDRASGWRDAGALHGKRAKVDGEVEVGAREGLRDCEAEEEVSG